MKVAIFIFPDVETLDFCGPLEVFSAANISHEADFFEVFTFAETTAPVRSINGLNVIPDYDIHTVPQPDILIIPGGNGTRQLIENEEVMGILGKLYEGTEYTFSVCSGARIPAVLGWLNGKTFTTHHLVFDDVQKLAPKAVAEPNNRFTDNGKILTSAGVAAGIDLSFYLLEKIKGKAIATATARYMEYPLTHSRS